MVSGILFEDTVVLLLSAGRIWMLKLDLMERGGGNDLLL